MEVWVSEFGICRFGLNGMYGEVVFCFYVNLCMLWCTSIFFIYLYILWRSKCCNNLNILKGRIFFLIKDLWIMFSNYGVFLLLLLIGKLMYCILLRKIWYSFYKFIKIYYNKLKFYFSLIRFFYLKWLWLSFWSKGISSLEMWVVCWL